MKHRLFIAIDLAVTTLGEIAALQPQLDKLKLPIIWEKHPHITLNFLGKADPKAIIPLIPPFPSFTLQPLYLDTLYSRHEPTILYLSLAKSEELMDLQKSLIVNLESITPQPRKFLPHITIGEFKRTDPVTTKHFIDVVSDFATSEFSEILVDKVILYESLPSKVGTTYRQISQFMLQSKLE